MTMKFAKLGGGKDKLELDCREDKFNDMITEYIYGRL